LPAKKASLPSKGGFLAYAVVVDFIKMNQGTADNKRLSDLPAKKPPCPPKEGS